MEFLQKLTLFCLWCLASQEILVSCNPLPDQPAQLEEQYPPQPYSFNYNVQGDDGGSHSHQESSDGSGKVTGSYSITLPDGRTRTVTYTADASGYNAQITTNELGTESKNPANVEFLSQAVTGEQAAYQTKQIIDDATATANELPVPLDSRQSHVFIYPFLRKIKS